MKKVKYLLYLLVLLVFLLMGCKKEEESVVEGTGVFYLNTEGTGLTKKAYTLKGSKAEEQVEELLAELTKETDSIDYVSVLPVDVEIESWELNGTKLNHIISFTLHILECDLSLLAYLFHHFFHGMHS